MRIFNRALATIFSIALILGSAIAIVYLIGRLLNSGSLTGLVDGWSRSLAALDPGQVQALLLGIFAISLILFILEVRPWRQPFINIRDDESGTTQVARADVERYLMQRLSKDMQRTAITPERVDLQVRGGKFAVATGLAIPSRADRQAVLSLVESDIKGNLSSIGLDEDLERVSAKISRVKEVA